MIAQRSNARSIRQISSIDYSEVVEPGLIESKAVECTVRFEPSGREVRVPAGTSLLQAARMAELPIATACGEHGLCARCGLEILQGAESLSPEPADEQETKTLNRIDPKLRLSCHLEVVADLVVTAPYW